MEGNLKVKMQKRQEMFYKLFLGALGAGGWGLWALERLGVAVTRFDNTEGKDEHKLVQ